MASVKKPAIHGTGRGPNEAAPPWADGLRQLYDSVVDEPLPDAFRDLLAQFDDGDDSAGPPGSGKAA